MSGGMWDKVGNWYEADYVLWQLLQVLNEQVQTVTWEGTAPQDEGIDCWVTANRRRSAQQCKSRSTTPWTIANVAEGRRRSDGTRRPSILSSARAQLERAGQDTVDEFVFVTTMSAPDWDKAITAAQSGMSPTDWLNDDTANRRRLIIGLDLSPDTSTDIARGFELIRRMQVLVIGQPALSKTLIGLAMALSSEPERLLASLRDYARSRVGHEVIAADLRHHVVGSVPLLPRENQERLGALFDNFAAEYQQVITSTRRLAEIIRPEAGAAYTYSIEPGQARTIIVHGPAGSGKSEVLLQTIARCRAAGVPVLVLRAENSRDARLPADPVQTLRRYAGNRRACLVIDQLDQVTLAGDHAQQSLDPILRWVRMARSMDIAVIVGCRTVDIEHDTQLRQVFRPDDREQYRIVPVGDLSDTQSAAILTAAGIPIDSLHPDLRVLTRRPLVLHLLTDLVRHGGTYSAARTVIDLVCVWWERLRLPWAEQADAVLDALVKRVESDGTLSVDRALLPHRSVVEQLVATGVLVEDATVGSVRPFHQTIVDVWLARQWSDVQTFEQLLGHIGARDDQDILSARRLRLMVPILATRGELGARICHDNLHSPLVRSFVKRAMLMGLATVESPSPILVHRVETWLDDASVSDIVRTIVLYKQPMWITALSGWIDRRWNAGDVSIRDGLLHLLASVSQQLGDAVATFLERWSAQDSRIFERAEWVFWHDPSHDSDLFFEQRLRFMAETRLRDRGPDWPRLLESHPMRAIRLLAYYLERADNATLLKRSPSWLHNWPAALPQGVRILGSAAWFLVRDRWKRLEVEHAWDIDVDPVAGGQSACVALVNLLAETLAHALSTGQLTWANLVDDLPKPPQLIDGWLLLRVGASLDRERSDPQVSADALRWFMGTTDWAHARIGSRSRAWDLTLASMFLETVCGLSPNTEYEIFESWLINYPDAWTAEDERTRAHMAQATGHWQPNERGLTAYLLLPHTHPNRWKSSTLSASDALKRKFDPHRAILLRELGGQWGMVRSVVPDAIAHRWTPHQWIEAIRSAPVSDRWRRTNPAPGVLAASDQGTLIGQLGYIAPCHPQTFAAAIESLLDARSGLPDTAVEVVVHGIIRVTPPDRPAAPPGWTSLSDLAVANILYHPRVAQNPIYNRAIIEAMRDRSGFAWSDAAVETLIAVAHGEAHAVITQQDDEDLMLYRMNEDACMALAALGHIAIDHPERRIQLLEVASSLSRYPDPGRRAEAAMLAWRSGSVDPIRSSAIILDIATDPLVAGEPDLFQALLAIIQQPLARDDQRTRAQDTLLGLVTQSGELSKSGGVAAIVLRAWGRIPPSRMAEILVQSTTARTAAAEQIAHWFKDPESPPWIRELAIEYANDPEHVVRSTIMFGMHHLPEQLLSNHAFLLAMSRSEAARDDAEWILDACDQAADLMTVADIILMLAQSLHGPPPEGHEAWKRSHQADHIANLLMKLGSESDRLGNHEMRVRALAAWDRLIDAGVLSAQESLRSLTALEISSSR